MSVRGPPTAIKPLAKDKSSKGGHYRESYYQVCGKQTKYKKLVTQRHRELLSGYDAEPFV